MTLDDPTKAKDGDPTQEPGSEKTSAAEEVTSKIEEGKQYSGAEAKKLVQDALSADGRAQKDRADKAEKEVSRLSGVTEDLTTQLTTISGQMAQIQKEREEAEREAVKDDPVALSSLRTKQANAAEALRLAGIDATLKANEAKLAARETEIKKQETTANIKLAALEAGVDAKELAELVPDGDPDRLKKAAKILKGSGVDPVTGKPRPAAFSQRPASAVSAGARLGDLSADDKITYGLEQKKK